MNYINSPTQIGRILASRRKAMNLSQQAVAVRLGISQNRLSELEDHPEKLSVQRLLVLLNLLGLELAIRERAGSGKSARVEW